jgi:hypothetical protein
MPENGAPTDGGGGGDALDLRRTRIESSPHAPFEARRFLRREALELDAGTLDDLLLLITELVSANVLHDPVGVSVVEIDLSDESCVRATVSGRGVAAMPLRPSEAGDALRDELNVMLLDRLAAAWGRIADDDGVWLQLDRPAHGRRFRSSHRSR